MASHPCTIRPAQKNAATKQLRIVHALLDCIQPFPARKGLRKNVMRPGQERVAGFTLGVTRKLDVKDRLVESRYNQMYPELFMACQRLLTFLDPSFKYNCIQVNKNTRTAKHTDAHNKGPSVFIAFGSHRGGGVLLHTTNAPTHLPDGTFYNFDGRIPHETEPFSGGTRYSLVFFTASLTQTRAMQQDHTPMKTCPRTSR